MVQSDEELILACRSGDEEAWSALVLRYQRLIYTVARRAGLDEDTASDVFQQVFTTLVKYLDHIERPSQIHAWLVTTARRETLRVIRKEQSGKFQSIDEEPDNQDKAFDRRDQAPLQDEVLLRLELEHRVRTEVSALDEMCRELLTLLFYINQPLPYAEISRRLGISEGSIGPSRARCLQKLQNKMHRIK